ncbi:IS110 family RNA-guided transposase [Fundicoccus culcitae]|uniref:IS110 family transposase n=1 Tax=Fundicoccus culcitae TaxID=2969821 RepID=A0ABY5P502_9LACT|nr:IS110 family transposase [Fundicoccus culcitae]UUX33560.1 IS110 family transposase [Fundicoccus culcitae]
MDVMVEKCAGIDVHKSKITVCVLIGEMTNAKPKRELKTFGTTTMELHACAQWLVKLGITTVLMESTGQYWRPIWNILEPYQFQMILANAQHIKQVPGRKTDIKDAQWIAELGRCGLVNGSYVPDRDIQDLRQLTRHRSSVKEDLTRRKNQVHDILQRSNFKLSSYLSDIFGKTGQTLLHMFINGEAITEKTLEDKVHKRVLATLPQLVEAMNGSLTKVNRQLLKLELETINRLETECQECEYYIEEHIEKYEDVYLRLLEIPGVSRTTAQVILAEIGPTVDAFETAEKLASWAGLCPGSYESAGIQYGSKTTRGNRYLKAALCRAGLIAGRSNNQDFRSVYYKFKERNQKSKGIVALAHKILRIVYALIDTGESYDPGKQKKTPATAIA